MYKKIIKQLELNDMNEALRLLSKSKNQEKLISKLAMRAFQHNFEITGRVFDLILNNQIKMGGYDNDALLHYINSLRRKWWNCFIWD